MNSLQIEYFLAVADNLSFSKTAEEKYVSQPAISKHIFAIEAELGVTLFERNNRYVKLTEAGHLFADFFRKQQQTMEQIVYMIRKTDVEEKIPLRVGCISSWNMNDFMPEIIQRISTSHSNIKIMLENNHITGLTNTLLSNDTDVAIALATPLRASSQLVVRTLTRIPHVIIYSDYHPAAKKEKVTPSDFKDDIFFIPAPNEATYIVELVKSYCEPYGFLPKIQSVKGLESSILGVSNGLGVAIADSWISRSYQNLRSIELESRQEIAVAWRNGDENPAIPIFIHELASHFYPNGDSGFDPIAI